MRIFKSWWNGAHCHPAFNALNVVFWIYVTHAAWNGGWMLFVAGGGLLKNVEWMLEKLLQDEGAAK